MNVGDNITTNNPAIGKFPREKPDDMNYNFRVMYCNSATQFNEFTAFYQRPHFAI